MTKFQMIEKSTGKIAFEQSYEFGYKHIFIIHFRDHLSRGQTEAPMKYESKSSPNRPAHDAWMQSQLDLYEIKEL